MPELNRRQMLKAVMLGLVATGCSRIAETQPATTPASSTATALPSVTPSATSTPNPSPTSTPRDTATPRLLPPRITAMAGDGRYSLFLSENGRVWEWQIRATSSSPGLLESLPTADFRQVTSLEHINAIDASRSLHLALSEDGTVWHWGDLAGIVDETPRQVHGLNDVVQISAGRAHGLALRSDGTVWNWGWQLSGPVSDGPVPIPQPLHVEPLPSIKAIAAGGGHDLAVDEEGRAWAWGSNEFGALGDGRVICLQGEISNTNCTEYTDEIPFEATPVPVVNLTSIAAVAAYYESLALLEDGTVWDWGYLRKTVPGRVEGLTEITDISAGDNIHAALKQDGTVWIWGDFLARDTRPIPRNDIPRPVPVLSDAVAIEAMNGYDGLILVQRSDGSLWTAKAPRATQE